MPGEVRSGREDTLVALGQTASGRYLKVIYKPEVERDSAFVIQRTNCAERLSVATVAASGANRRDEDSTQGSEQVSTRVECRQGAAGD
jgi:hypothetical protein